MSRVMPQRRHVVVTVCLEQADAFSDVDRSEGPGQRARDRAPRGQYPAVSPGAHSIAVYVHVCPRAVTVSAE